MGPPGLEALSFGPEKFSINLKLFPPLYFHFSLVRTPIIKILDLLNLGLFSPKFSLFCPYDVLTKGFAQLYILLHLLLLSGAHFSSEWSFYSLLFLGSYPTSFPLLPELSLFL